MKRLLIGLAILWAGAAVAQENPASNESQQSNQSRESDQSSESNQSKLNIELNNISVNNSICQVYIRVRNATETAYDAFKIDLAFFDKGGVINDRVLVDLAPLRDRKTSIHVFDMPDLDCDNVGEVLLNDITECVPDEGSARPSDCFDAVELSAKGDIAFVR